MAEMQYIQLPDGSYQELPADMPDDEIKRVLQPIIMQTEPNRERVRAAIQGATFGLGEEAEALARSLVPGSRGYTQIRDELRGKLKQYEQDYPLESLGYEMAGGMATGGTGLLRSAAVGGLKRAAGTGAIEGALSGFGYGEGDVGQQVASTATGAATGAVLGPVAEKAGQLASAGVQRFNRYVSEKFGSRANDAVQKELARLVEMTGKGEEQILQELAQGRRIAENQTLAVAIQKYVADGGEAGKTALEGAKSAQKQRIREANQALREELAPGMDANVMRSWKASDDEAKALERASYNELFKQTNPTVTPEIGATIEDIVNRYPDVLGDVNKLLKGRKADPLFVNNPDTGEFILARLPTLEEAEYIYRPIRDNVDQLFTSGAGTLASDIKNVLDPLKRQLDEFSPELKSVRARAAQVRSARDAFALGRKALNPSANVDEMELLVESIADKPEQLKALRAGFMDSIRQKVRKGKTTLGKLAEETTQFGDMLRTIAPEESIQTLEQKLGLAAEVHEIATKAPVTAGSATAKLQAEGRRQGAGGTVEDVVELATNPNLSSIGRLFDGVFNRVDPGLTPEQRSQVIDLIYSTDRDLVERALTDDYAYRQLAERVGQLAEKVGLGARATLQQQAAQATAPEVEPGILDMMLGGAR